MPLLSLGDNKENRNTQSWIEQRKSKYSVLETTREIETALKTLFSFSLVFKNHPHCNKKNNEIGGILIKF